MGWKIVNGKVAYVDPMVARSDDPPTSQLKMDEMKTNVKLKDAVLKAASTFEYRAFTDTNLTDVTSQILGAPQQRNVIARQRLRLERQGYIIRLPYKDGRELRFTYAKERDVA